MAFRKHRPRTVVLVRLAPPKNLSARPSCTFIYLLVVVLKVEVLDAPPLYTSIGLSTVRCIAAYFKPRVPRRRHDAVIHLESTVHGT